MGKRGQFALKTFIGETHKLDNAEAEDDETVCRFRVMDYLELVDSTGRALRDDKRGAISTHAAGVLDRLGIDEKTWLAHMRPKQQRQPIHWCVG